MDHQSTIVMSLLQHSPSPELTTIIIQSTESSSFFDPINISSLSNTSLSTLILGFPIDASAIPSSMTTTNLPPPIIRSAPYHYSSWSTAARIQVPLYAAILLLALVGNALVILTLVHNRRMRTITNVFLLNLAISDMLLGVLCMPITLVGALLRNFVFGEAMCKILPFLQASSVSVSAWTLVAISCERYYAICHPLRSRRWQTLRHSYKLIALIWCGSLVCMSPIAFLSQLIPTNNGHHKCRDQWPADWKDLERVFNVLLDVVLLVLPLLMLGSTYSLITHTLWKGMLAERMSRRNSRLDVEQSEKGRNASQLGHTFSPSLSGSAHPFGKMQHYVSTAPPPPTNSDQQHRKIVGYMNYTSAHPVPQYHQSHKFQRAESDLSYARCSAIDSETSGSGGGSISRTGIVWHQIRNHRKQLKLNETATSSSPSCMQSATKLSFGLRRTNTEKSLQNKKRVIKMLFVVVLEFFICWTPLYVINTVALFYPALVYQTLGIDAITFMQLLAYSSSCCNPITYCFMNRGFRKACCNLFRCCRPRSRGLDRRRFSMVGGVTQSSEVT